MGLRGDCFKRVLKSWTRAGVLAVKHAQLWVFLFATASVSELLYQAFGGVATWDFPPWEFTTKLPMDKNDWFCCKVQGFSSAPELKTVSQSPSWCQSSVVTLWITWKWKENINFSGIYNLLPAFLLLLLLLLFFFFFFSSFFKCQLCVCVDHHVFSCA